MRILGSCLLAILSGCASFGGPAQNCSVIEYVGGLSTPAGLIRLDPVVEQSLRAQIPEKFERSYMCWYAHGEELLAIAGKNAFPHSGFTFKKVDGVWRLSADIAPMLESPKYIQ
jgi:hypothetical protein